MWAKSVEVQRYVCSGQGYKMVGESAMGQIQELGHIRRTIGSNLRARFIYKTCVAPQESMKSHRWMFEDGKRTQLRSL